MTEEHVEAVGIDLGTTFSEIAHLDDNGQPVTLVNAEGDRTTPSMVLFDGEDVIVGKEALKAFASEADRVAECSKRDMGNRVYHKAIEGKQYPPEVIGAFVLNKLRVDAQAQIGPLQKVVITVPAYFDEVRRKATQDSGYMAGFEVLDIINEPTAAAVAFGAESGFLNAEGTSDKPLRVVVYDLGGGTFDVTVMEIHGAQSRPWPPTATGFSAAWTDQRLVNLGAEHSPRTWGRSRGKTRVAPASVARVRGRQTHALRSGKPSSLRLPRPRVARGNLRQQSRRPPRTCSTAPVSPPARPSGPPVWSGARSTACCSPAVRPVCPWSAS